jgi:hypothetical protein
MWRCYVQASEIAVRWSRQLMRDQLGPNFEEGLDQLLIRVIDEC